MALTTRALGLVTSLVMLAGCSGAPTTPPTGATQPGATTASTATPTPTLTPGVAAIPGIAAEVFKSSNPARKAELSVPAIPGATKLNTVLRESAAAEKDAFERGTAGSELAGGWMLELQQWPLVGVRTQSATYHGAHALTTTRTLYSDVPAGQVWRSSELVASGSQKDAAAAVRSAVTAAKATPPAGTSDESVLADLRFDASGNLVAQVATGGTPRPGGGVVEVTLPASSVTGWLSEAGHRVQQAYAAHWSAVRAKASTTSAATASPGTGATPDGGVRPDCSKQACVALTFDDGPGPYTDLLLDDLSAAGVKATFFEIGQDVHARSTVTARQARLGHVIGTHTADHSNLGKLPLPAQADAVARGAAAIESAGGGKVSLLRPPYGNMNLDTTKLGYPLILWDTDSQDWESLDAEAATATTLKSVRRGSIVLMHDLHPTSVDAVPGLIGALKQKGFTLVTVPELLGTPEVGTTYFSRRQAKKNYSSVGMTVVPATPGGTAAPSGATPVTTPAPGSASAPASAPAPTSGR